MAEPNLDLAMFLEPNLEVTGTIHGSPPRAVELLPIGLYACDAAGRGPMANALRAGDIVALTETGSRLVPRR